MPGASDYAGRGSAWQPGDAFKAGVGVWYRATVNDVDLRSGEVQVGANSCSVVHGAH